MLIGDVQRAAALMYVSMQRDTRTALASLLSREVYDHLEDRDLIYRPTGWGLGSYLVTTKGHQELERLLSGGQQNEKTPAKPRGRKSHREVSG